MNNNITNLVAAIFLSVAIIFGWQYFYEKPKLEKLTQQHIEYNKKIESLKQEIEMQVVSNMQQANTSNRIKIKSPVISGSLNLKGLRFDDITLLRYKRDLSPDSDYVKLLSPSGTQDSYFAEIGWYSQDPNIVLPNTDTNWQADKNELTPDDPINLQWTSPDGVKFLIKIALDTNYLFTIEQSIINHSKKHVTLQHYMLINNNYSSKEKLVNILHQGPISVIDGQLNERSYDEVKDKQNEKFALKPVDWLGITDKYWFTAFIPDKKLHYNVNYHYAIQNGFEKFQVDCISPVQIIESGSSSVLSHRFFAGSKKVKLLDYYENEYNIKLFDRAIDFGWFYILTKPVFNTLNFFYDYVGNFGISILIVTIIIKLAMFTLANKSYRSMKNMKNLQPEIERIKRLYENDKTRLNQEVMALYKKEKVNPVSGCLPLLIQIPVFFSIYKVLYVTIEMRHAPFYGWIKDLSAPDPTTIFNLFGLLPYTPPSILMIGAWPIIMALTMFFQQQLGPSPADPVQAKVMKFMPLIFLVMFSSFPVGLLIYWSWNNILSIVQQYYINKLDKDSNARK